MMSCDEIKRKLALAFEDPLSNRNCSDCSIDQNKIDIAYQPVDGTRVFVSCVSCHSGSGEAPKIDFQKLSREQLNSIRYSISKKAKDAGQGMPPEANNGDRKDENDQKNMEEFLSSALAK